MVVLCLDTKIRFLLKGWGGGGVEFVGSWAEVFTLYFASIVPICMYHFNTLQPAQIGRYFASDILKCIFVNQNCRSFNHVSLKFVPGVIDNHSGTFLINSLMPSDAYASATYANIGSNNGLWPGRQQDIIWTDAGILLIGPLGRNFSEILIEIYTFLFKKIRLKMSSGNCRPFCLTLNVWKTSATPTSCIYIKYVNYVSRAGFSVKTGANLYRNVRKKRFSESKWR